MLSQSARRHGLSLHHADENDGVDDEAAAVGGGAKAPLVHGWLGSLVTPEWWSYGRVGDVGDGGTDGAL